MATTKTRKPRAAPTRKRQPAKKIAKTEPRKRYTGKPGRPSLLTAKVTKEILDGVREGMYVEHAVKAAGLHPDTVYRWLARARKEIERVNHEHSRLEAIRSEGVEPDEPEPEVDPEEARFVEFFEAMEQAESECMRFHVSNLTRIARSRSDLSSAARASLNILERRWPKLWSRAERSDVTVSETSVSFIEIHTVEEQKERTRETLDVLESSGALELAAIAAGKRALPSRDEADDDDDD